MDTVDTKFPQVEEVLLKCFRQKRKVEPVLYYAIVVFRLWRNQNWIYRSGFLVVQETLCFWLQIVFYIGSTGQQQEYQLVHGRVTWLVSDTVV